MKEIEISPNIVILQTNTQDNKRNRLRTLIEKDEADLKKKVKYSVSYLEVVYRF